MSRVERVALTVDRYLPNHALLEQLGRALGHWAASRSELANVFDSPEAAREQAETLLADVTSRPTCGFLMAATEELAQQVREEVSAFCDAHWQAGQQYREGGVSDSPALSMASVRNAYPNHQLFRARPCVEHSDCLVMLEPPNAGDECVEDNWWTAEVRLLDGRNIVLVEAEVYMAMGCVGPVIINWSGRDEIRGLHVLMEVLKRSYGDSLALELNAWKVAQSEKDLASLEHTIPTVLPLGFEPVRMIGLDGGPDECRAALIRRTGAEDSDVHFWVTLGPISNVREYLRRRKNTLITDVIAADDALISELRRVIDKFINPGSAADGQSSEAAEC